MSNAENTAV